MISDYIAVHYLTPAREQYERFAWFLRYQAPQVYPEGGSDAAYATPDAVRIMTVHAAKGMEFPTVFLPALQANRFPTRRMYEKVWEYLPREAVEGAARYETTEEDERRLLYVAITRAEKYLFATYAPDETANLYRKPSPFFVEMTQDDHVLTQGPPHCPTTYLTPKPRKPLVNVQLSFSDLRFLLECPKSFKLQCLYGFRPVVNPRMGYGTSLHNALAEIHRRSMAGERFAPTAQSALVEELLERHLHARYATSFLTEQLRRAVRRDLTQYLRFHGDKLARLEHVELVVEVAFDDGIVVSGRIDTIRHTETNERVIVDFKTRDRAPEEEVSLEQLRVYVLGDEQRTGKRADLIERFNVSGGSSEREIVDDALLDATKRKVKQAGERLRSEDLPRLKEWNRLCEGCEVRGICRDKPVAATNMTA